MTEHSATDEAFETLIAPLRRADVAHARIIKILIGVITAMSLIVLGLTYSLVRIDANSKGLAKVTALCEKTNESNAIQLDLWNFILSVPPSTPPTAAQAQIRREFEQRINKAFAQKDCNL